MESSSQPVMTRPRRREQDPRERGPTCVDGEGDRTTGAPSPIASCENAWRTFVGARSRVVISVGSVRGARNLRLSNVVALECHGERPWRKKQGNLSRLWWLSPACSREGMSCDCDAHERTVTCQVCRHAVSNRGRCLKIRGGEWDEEGGKRSEGCGGGD